VPWSPGSSWWQALLAVAVGLVAALVVAWLLLVLLLWRSGRARPDLAGAARLLPDLLRLVTRLARDASLPRRVRVHLWLLLAYLASPVDLVPDIVPVVGLLDDVVAVLLVLGVVIRAAGTEAVRRHWPGDETGLVAVLRLAGGARRSGLQGAGEQQHVDGPGQSYPVGDEDAEGVRGHVAQEPVDRRERDGERHDRRDDGRAPRDR
jgi:uncharacterized membrane protein YkvA (DUF1232 family)